MIIDMSKAAQGALRLDKKFDIVANRLANAGTAGYKAENLTFDAVFRPRLRLDFQQGDSVTTGNPLDLAISGEGFFKVQTPQGERYTRNGTFTRDKDNYLITQDGYRVLGDGGPILLKGDRVSISGQGDIDVDGTRAGKLQIVRFDDPQKLQKERDTLLAYKGDAAADEQPATQMTLQQGIIEQANVSVVKEMTNMIEISRNFETFQKLMQTYDEIDGKAVSEVGQVR